MAAAGARAAGAGSGIGVRDVQQGGSRQGMPGGAAGAHHVGGGGGHEQGVFEAFHGTESLPDSPNLLLHFPDLGDLPDVMPDGGAVAGVAALEPPVLPDHDQQQQMEQLQQPQQYQQQQKSLRLDDSAGFQYVQHQHQPQQQYQQQQQSLRREDSADCTHEQQQQHQLQQPNGGKDA